MQRANRVAIRAILVALFGLGDGMLRIEMREDADLLFQAFNLSDQRTRIFFRGNVAAGNFARGFGCSQFDEFCAHWKDTRIIRPNTLPHSEPEIDRPGEQ